jgi:hypothetical protein
MEVSIVNAYILYCCHKTQLGAKPVPHVRYWHALVECLVGEVHNPRERSHTGSADRDEQLNKLPHFIYRLEKKITKNALCAVTEQSKPGKEHIFTIRCAQIDHPFVQENVLNYIIPWWNSKVISVSKNVLCLF